MRTQGKPRSGTTPYNDTQIGDADVTLVRRMADGDETALAILYDRYSGLVFSVAKRILKNSSAAEEILQDVFYRAWRGASMFDANRGSMAGWPLVASRNRAIDRLRRGQGHATGPISENTISLTFSLETEAAQKVMLAKVKSAMRDLPESQRTALELAYFDGLTQSEIAERTGEPLGTVKTRLRAALGTLKKVFHS